MYVELDRLQYFHATRLKGYKEEFTIACEVPTKGMLLQAMNPSFPFVFKVGYAFVNKKDMYCRHTGRVVSVNRMEEDKFTINLIKFFPDKIHFYFTGSKNNMLIFEMKNDRKRVYLLDATK